MMATTTLPQLKGTKRNKQAVQKSSPRGYTVENAKYTLPPPRLLKPFVDTTAGELDTWPAHASGQQTNGPSAFLSKNKSLVLYNEEDMGKAKVIPKPRFLDQLENFLKKEMRALGITEVQPNELRLQAHREVFEYLIEDFKTYKPLLSAVKNEYEMMLAYQRQQIRELEPLKQMLVTVSEQCDHKVMAIREEEKKDMVELKQENQRLRFKIEEMRNAQIDLESQVSKLHEELQVEYHKYRDECDARKLLLSDINDLRYQQEDNLMSKQNMQEAEEVQEDPVTLKIALRKAREDEKEATEKLNEMIANYGDVIPRRDFESLESKYKALEQSMQTSVNDFKKLKAEHDALLDLQKQITQQRDEYYLECETLRRTATPRPDWNKCSDHIGGGMERWQQISDGKTSNELLDVLLGEMASGEIVDFDGAEYIEGQGTGPDVPKYLQYEGSVKNRKVGKRDCSLLIKDIWKEKLTSDAERTDGTREFMPDLLHSYLNKRFAVETMVVEWAYNLHDACQRYAHDENIGLFWGILKGDIDEEVYHNNLVVITTLLNSFMKVDTEKGSTESLSKEDFKTVLSEYFGEIDDESLMIMVQAAETELDAKGAEELEYQNLFMEEDDGKTGPFLEEVRKFSKKLKLSYVADIQEQLGDISLVSVEDLKRAVSLTDPEIDNVKMDKYLTWAFNTTTDNLFEIEPVEQSQIIDRLKNGNVKRIGKKM